MSFRTWLEQSKLLYKSYVLFQAPAHILVLGQKLYFQLKNHVLLHTVFSTTFCGSVELSYEKVKREIIRCIVRCFI